MSNLSIMSLPEWKSDDATFFFPDSESGSEFNFIYAVKGSVYTM